jgi:glutaredoxin
VSSEQQKLSQPTVTFYTKAGCHLCDDARELLEDIATEIPYNLTEVDIRNDTALFELYRYRIPVIIVDETHMVEGRIEYNDLLGAFQR